MSGVITSMLLLGSSLQNALNQVNASVNAATPSTLGIVGTWFLAGTVILTLICVVWVNFSETRRLVEERGPLDALAIRHIFCTLCFLVLGVIELSEVVDIIAPII